MDSMLQRHCARYIYVIPDGLRELMSDISREVLRSQPTDVYTFIADYLDALMITRENARVAARLVESLTEMATTTATFLEETGMPRDEIDNIMSAIQKTFRKSIDAEHDKEPLPQHVEEENVVSDILAEIHVSPEQANVAATIIQQAYIRFKERKEREKRLLAGMVDWRVAARSAIHLYRKTGVTNEEANRAATLIKAAYKGYYARRLMKRIITLEGGFQDYQYPEYLEEDEEEEEGEGDFMVDDEKTKSVKIDYNTVKPHVDFDTSESKITSSHDEIPPQVSTASNVAKYSLKSIFDQAFERIARESVVAEETTYGKSDDEDEQNLNMVGREENQEDEVDTTVEEKRGSSLMVEGIEIRLGVPDKEIQQG